MVFIELQDVDGKSFLVNVALISKIIFHLRYNSNEYLMNLLLAGGYSIDIPVKNREEGLRKLGLGNNQSIIPPFPQKI